VVRSVVVIDFFDDDPMHEHNWVRFLLHLWQWTPLAWRACVFLYTQDEILKRSTF
jgi:hypothetical protein